MRSGNHRIYFIEVPDRNDDFDLLKGWLKKRLGRAYYTVGVRVLAPTFSVQLRPAGTAVRRSGVGTRGGRWQREQPGPSRHRQR
jgi:hypothetical protein